MYKELCGQNISKALILMETPKKNFLGREISHFIRRNIYKSRVFFSRPLTFYFSIIYFPYISIISFLMLLSCSFFQNIFKLWLCENFVLKMFYKPIQFTHVLCLESFDQKLQGECSKSPWHQSIKPQSLHLWSRLTSKSSNIGMNVRKMLWPWHSFSSI